MHRILLIIAASLALIMALTALGVYVPWIPIYSISVKSYNITLNLSHSILPYSELKGLEEANPLLYQELMIDENYTPPWIGVANREYTLIIANATPTPMPILIKASSMAIGQLVSFRVSIYIIRCGFLVINPLSFYARWFIVLATRLGDYNVSVFAFETGPESLGDVLGNLTTGGYLVEGNGERYGLIHSYIYLGRVYRVFPLPGVVAFYLWFGNDLNSSYRVLPMPQYLNGIPFPNYTVYFKLNLSQFINQSLVYSMAAGPNSTVGFATDYGYDIYGIPRLIPFGPIVYYTPILLLNNGTLLNPTCYSPLYGIDVVFLFLNPAYGTYTPIVLYSTLNGAMGLVEVNGSLITGGFLYTYDFYNLTMIYITPLYPWIRQGVPISECGVAIYGDSPLIQYLSLIDVPHGPTYTYSGGGLGIIHLMHINLHLW